MRLSTTTNIYYKRPDGRNRRYSESVAKIAAAGFDCVDFQFNNLVLDAANELCGDSWERETDYLVKVLAENKIVANQAHAPFYDFLDPDLLEKDFKKEMTRRSIIIAGRLGIKWIVMHPCTLFGNPRKKDNYDANLEYFKPMIELASECGVGIAIENIFDKFARTSGSKFKLDTNLSRKYTDVKIRTVRHFANWPEDLAEFVDALSAYGNIGACWDTGHGNEMMVDQKASIEILGDRLKALHVNDNFGMHDNHLLPYFGEIHWEEILCTLKNIGYNGDFTFETGMNFNRIPEELVDAALKYAEKVGRYMIRQFS